ncbi:MAG TPA: dehydrogenase [Cyanobacteria bacterium UBA8803]|nr:dehydrogenase [Cyanobacteria bacterium UBA9273]HBL61244.1 dehydrogenase [Cyanobacteria bacterium UBA8803]
MQQLFTLSFKKNISLIEEATDNIVLQSPLITLNSPQITLHLKQLSPGLLSALKLLGTDGATEEHLCNLVLQTDGLPGLYKFYDYLQKFINLGLICHSVLLEGVTLLTRVPISPLDRFQLKNAAADKKYILSRFAYCRKDKDQMVVESPLSHAQIVLREGQGAALFHQLFAPQSCQELCAKVLGISPDTALMIFNLLWSSHLISELQDNGEIQEDANAALSQWEFHDLLFHSRSRTGRHANPVGRTYRFLEKVEPLPAVKPKPATETENIPLYQPDLEKLKAADYPFTLILEARKSLRHYHEQPITDKQLGEFLYRCARIRQVMPAGREEISSRPYVNAGANYELELYLIVNSCQNISAGFYYYCPQEHQLCRLSNLNNHVAALLEEARLSNREQCLPQVAILISARFQRITWAYESIAYSGLLKNVGALYQTMYLVATAMDLAPCAIGSGNSDLFAAATGLDYYAETSVGEFIIGSKPRDEMMVR